MPFTVSVPSVTHLIAGVSWTRLPGVPVRASRLLPIVMLLSPLVGREAAACSCATIELTADNAAEAIASFDEVFLGQVTELRLVDQETCRDREAYGAICSYSLEASLRVLASWKGEHRESVIVRTSGGSPSCGYPFAVGRLVVV